MATLTADKAQAAVQPRANIGVTAAFSSYTVAANLAVNDIIQMLKVPKGAKILELVLTSTDLDSSGSPTLAYDVGDGSGGNRFIDGTTIGQGSGVARLSTVTGHLYEYTAEDTIDVLVATGPATAVASGTITLFVLYTLEGDVPTS